MSIFSGKRALLLDFDGTLGDTFSLHEEAFQETLAPYGLPFAYGDYIGQSTAEVFEHFFGKAGRQLSESELQALVRQKREAANRRYATHLRFIAGAEAFVQEAHRLGYHLYVGSSGSRRNIMAGIEGLGLSRYIRSVVTADDVRRGKPDPEIFLTLLDRSGVAAAEALVVEDAPSGIQAAQAAGIDVVCVDVTLTAHFPQAHPSLYFATFAQLLEELLPPAH